MSPYSPAQILRRFGRMSMVHAVIMQVSGPRHPTMQRVLAEHRKHDNMPTYFADARAASPADEMVALRRFVMQNYDYALSRRRFAVPSPYPEPVKGPLLRVFAGPVQLDGKLGRKRLQHRVKPRSRRGWLTPGPLEVAKRDAALAAQAKVKAKQEAAAARVELLKWLASEEPTEAAVQEYREKLAEFEAWPEETKSEKLRPQDPWKLHIEDGKKRTDRYLAATGRTVLPQGLIDAAEALAGRVKPVETAPEREDVFAEPAMPNDPHDDLTPGVDSTDRVATGD